jgi:hypothetical protein
VAQPPKPRLASAGEARRQGASSAQGLVPKPAGAADRIPLLVRGSFSSKLKMPYNNRP